VSPNLTKKFGTIIFGTDKLHGVLCKTAVKNALTAGYRIIDTAQAYGNEEAIGEAVQETGLARKGVFVITKISSGWWKNPQSFEEAYSSAQGSVRRLGMSYLDLLLVHAPEEDKKARIVTRQALEKLRKDVIAMHIGVNNYNAKDIVEMQTYSTTGPPAVNRIEVRDTGLCLMFTQLIS
jgi:diketogulonate reductase-like aldo/keto reductase